jgi:hypothetical protein
MRRKVQVRRTSDGDSDGSSNVDRSGGGGGGGASGKASRVMAADGAPGGSWIDGVGDTLLPWRRLRHGVYLDAYVSAIQRFDMEEWENENGIFRVLGRDDVRFSVTGPFKWPTPERRAVCAFQPTCATFQIGQLEWEWSLEADAGTAALWSTAAPRAEGSERQSFEQTRVTALPFFRWLLVDEAVAVAQGRSGGVAVWARVDE